MGALGAPVPHAHAQHRSIEPRTRTGRRLASEDSTKLQVLTLALDDVVAAVRIAAITRTTVLELVGELDRRWGHGLGGGLLGASRTNGGLRGLGDLAAEEGVAAGRSGLLGVKEIGAWSVLSSGVVDCAAKGTVMDTSNISALLTVLLRHTVNEAGAWRYTNSSRVRTSNASIVCTEFARVKHPERRAVGILVSASAVSTIAGVASRVSVLASHWSFKSLSSSKGRFAPLAVSVGWSLSVNNSGILLFICARVQSETSRTGTRYGGCHSISSGRGGKSCYGAVLGGEVVPCFTWWTRGQILA
jgi:hypothetical protein